MCSVVYITFLEKEGSFLKIWGQTDRNIPIAIEKSLAQGKADFDQGHFVPPAESLYVGQLLCAKYKDGMYYRARITNLSLRHQGIIEVHFIDYGNKDYLPYVNTRLMTNALASLVTIPPQSKDFILAQITHVGLQWDENVVMMISNEIRYIEMQFNILAQVGPYSLIRLSTGGEDLASNLVARSLCVSIAIQTQQMVLESYISRSPFLPLQSQPQLPIVGQNTQNLTPLQSRIPSTLTSLQSQPNAPIANYPPLPVTPIQSQNLSNSPLTPVVATPTLLSYKASSLDAGTEHVVYVSYVSDGPLQFSVQLKKMEGTLAKLMNDLNRMPLQPLEEDAIPGTVCVAKCLEDGYICRAVVTSVVDSLFKVFYVDFGNSELVPLENLFQAPFKYIIPKVMAMRFALTGLDKTNVTIEMKCAFKEFVSNRQLTMRVSESSKRAALATCELWDENGVNVIEVLKQAAIQSYPDPVALNRGLSQDVRVSYVFSCNKFFVQLKNKEEELHRLMVELQEVYPKLPPIQSVKEGVPCCAFYEADGQWYRAQVLSAERDQISVKYVDYGNEEPVSALNLRNPMSEHVTGLRPQALECCLNGYQNMEVDQERDSLLEELILEKDFSMKVVDIQDNRVLVELFDSGRYNVSSLLLEKIAASRSQVSPLLIQDGMKFDHRKRHSGSEESPGKQKSYAVRPERESWRQNKQRNEWNEDKTDAHKNDFGRSPDGDSRPNFRDRRDNRFDNKRENRFDDKRENRFDNKRENRFDDNKRDDRFNDNRRNFRKENKSDDFAQDSFSERRDNNKFGEDRGFRDRRDQNKGDFGGRNKDRGFNQENRNFGDGQYRNKKPDFKREGSEKSFSDSSEKSWKKGPRTNFKNDGGKPRFDKKFDNRNRDFSNNQKAFNGVNDESSWDVGNVTELPDFAPADAVFKTLEVANTEAKVSISWFYNPGQFYCQLDEAKEQLKTLMEDIQSAYTKRTTARATVGSPAIAVFPEDGVLYRAQILETHCSKYRVFYVDFGNTSTVDEVYGIERKFMDLPAQAVLCGLNGVAPPDNSWLNPDSYAEYFGKDGFVCRFLSKENERYLVDLFYDNLNLSEALISSNVALPSSGSGASQIEINLLQGQQLRVSIVEVTSLSDFKVFAVPDLTLQCAMHNLARATETFEDTLKNWVGNGVIIYVDNVVDERLEVTIYDTNGYKIEIIKPDEGAYETVDPLCPLPVFYSTLYGWVSHGAADSIYVQPSGFSDTVAQLLERLYQHYDGSILETPLTPECELLCAALSADGNWYRARIQEVDGESVTVAFVDYGNTEGVNVAELRELDAQFLELHVLALQVFMTGPTEHLAERDIALSLSFEEGSWAGAVVQEETVAPQALPEPAAAEIREEHGRTGLAAAREATASPTEAPSGLGVEVALTHIDSPSEFYLQLREATDSVDELQENLQNIAAELADLESPSAGALCAAPYSVDQQWYRAQVLDADDDITTVRFVDYGNTDVLNNSTTSVKTLPPELLALEQHARRCSLNIQPIGEEWTAENTARFEELTDGVSLTAEIISQDEKTTHVELYRNGESLTEILIKENVGKPLHTPTDTTPTGFVSNLNSPSEFWIQLESSVGDLEWIADQLSSAETYPELEDLTPGSLCAAVFPEDDNWYRARILSNTVAGIEVLFIDYGNSCTCSCLRSLPEDLLHMPALAQKFSLQKPQGIEQWTPQASEKFREIAADGAAIFEIRQLSTGETGVVELLLDGRDVGQMLLPRTLDCCVSKFEGLGEFYITKHGEGRQLEQVCKLEPLPGIQWNEEADEEFRKMNNEGTTLFQVEFVTSDLVRLYIDGRDIRPDLGGAKATPTSSATTTPKKTFDLNKELDESLLTPEDATDIIVEVVDGAVDIVRDNDKKELSEFVQEVVERAVDNSEILHPGKVKTDDEIVRDELKMEESTSENILSIAEEIMNKAVTESEERPSRIAENVLEDILNTATTTHESPEKTEDTEEARCSTPKNSENSPSKGDNLEGSPEKTEDTEEARCPTPKNSDNSPSKGDNLEGSPEKTEDTEEARCSTPKSSGNSPSKADKPEEHISPELYFTPQKTTSPPVKSDTDESTITAESSADSTPIKGSKPEEGQSPEEYFSPQELSSAESSPVEKNEDAEGAETPEPENVGDSSSQERNLEENDSAEIVENKVDVVISTGAGDSPVKACDENKTEDNKVKNAEVKDVPKTSEDSGSRPSSRGSGRFSVDERIVPAAISRTASPQPDSE